MTGVGPMTALVIHRLRCCGPLPAIGILLMVGATSVDLWQVGDSERRVQVARAETAALRAARADRPTAGGGDPLRQFHARLAPSDGASSALELLHKAAARHGVSIGRIDHRSSSEGGTSLLRHQIDLPVHTTYPQLRAWLGETKSALPTAAIENLSIRREEVDTEEIAAQIRLIVFARPVP